MKKEFFEKMDEMQLSLTYDDIRLKTGYSEVLPSETNLESKFSRNISLKIPIVSAAMDSVSEYEMAIAMAINGGISVIHKNLTPKEQASHVARVKNYLNCVVEKPICVQEDNTIESVLNRKREKNYQFDSYPVIDTNNKLVGIVTGNDFIFCDNYSLKIKDIMTKEPITGNADMTADEAYIKMQQIKKKIIPLTNSNNEVIGLYTFKDIKAIKSGASKHYNLDKKNRLIATAAIGVYDDAFARLELLIPNNIDAVVIDTAHGDSKGIIETIKKIKKEYNIEIIAGNVSEPESAERLAKAGVDAIKVGQGAGSICTTRIIAGIGCPQVTAIYKCSTIGEKYNIPIIADGGLKYSGDITIAIGTGAHSVMMGSMLAGTKEAPGEIIFYQGRQWKDYRGMGSLAAMIENKGSKERYLQTESKNNKLVPEGIEGIVPYKGELQEILFQYTGGLRSGMGYVGARTIEELREKADFRRITNAGIEESHPHDVTITKEAPNYRGR